MVGSSHAPDWEARKGIQKSGALRVVQKDLVDYDSISHVTGLDIQWGTDTSGVCVAAHMPFPCTAKSAVDYFVHHHTSDVVYKVRLTRSCVEE